MKFGHTLSARPFATSRRKAYNRQTHIQILPRRSRYEPSRMPMGRHLVGCRRIIVVCRVAHRASTAVPAGAPPPNPQPPQASANAGGAAVQPGYLGVVADDRQEKGAGVRIIELAAGGPAEQAGLKADDLITRINNTPIHDQNDMGPVLEKLPPGAKIRFTVDRGGQQQTVEVTLGQRPPPAQRKFEKFGAIPEPLPEPNAGGGLGPETLALRRAPLQVLFRPSRADFRPTLLPMAPPTVSPTVRRTPCRCLVRKPAIPLRAACLICRPPTRSHYGSVRIICRARNRRVARCLACAPGR